AVSSLPSLEPVAPSPLFSHHCRQFRR
ncbi:hypothetical protein CCACVL1_02393, partial [Corchorus capsularis]